MPLLLILALSLVSLNAHSMQNQYYFYTDKQYCLDEFNNKSNNSLKEFYKEDNCVFYRDKEEKLSKKYELKINMTVADITSKKLGKLMALNKISSAGNTYEQWVYRDVYLYFVNGKLISIQE